MQFSRLKPSAVSDGLVRKRVAFLVSLGFAILAAGTAEVAAQSPPPVTWTGPGGEWTTAGNWNPATVPTNTAAFTNNGAPTAVTISNSTSINTMEFAPVAPAYSFTVTNGASFAINTAIDNSSPSLPNFAVNAGSTLTIGDTADIAIGSLSNGPSGGGTVVIGPTDVSTFLTVAGGTNTTFSGSFSGAGSLELANSSTTLTLTGASNGGNIGTIGGDLTLCDCFGGGLTISGGSLTVNGLGMGVTVFGGTLSVINGGRLDVGLDLLVADAMTVSGPGSSVTVNGFTGVGIFGTGQLAISNGGTLNSQGGAEIDALFGTPSVAVTGAGSTWNLGGVGLAVGGGSTGGPGLLTISNGGAVNVTGGVSIGDAGPGTSTLIVTGPGAVLNMSGALRIGDPCDCLVGTLTIADGAVVNSPSFTGIGVGSTLNLGIGGLSGAIVTPGIVNDGEIVANFTDVLTLAANISGLGTLGKSGTGTLILTGNNTYSGGTTVTGGLINFAAAANLGTGTVTLNGGGLQWAAGNTSDISAQLAVIGSGGATFDTNGNNVSFAAALSGSGGLTKAGGGTLTLNGINGYTGGTTVNGGILRLVTGASLVSTGALAVNGGTFDLNGNNQTVTALSGTGGGITLGSGTLTAGDSANTTLAAAISGTGGLIKQGSGVLTLTANNTFSGGTILNAGGLVVNGSLASGVTVNGGTLQGTGSIGALAVNSGVVAPGNSIGTLTVNGNFTQGGGSVYQVEVNAAGQGDRINVNGAATINGAAVQVVAQPGTYARNTTYTILNASGGVNGAYSGVTSNFDFAFLTPSLSYDANNVYLLLFQPTNAFAAGAQTPNQYAVGTVLDQVNATATGDLNTVLNALSALSTQQGPAALNAISGQQYADFGTTNIQGAALFMNVVGQQMALARGSAGGGQRQALAQACEVEACDGVSPWSVWASALGGLGSVAGNGNSSTLTYNFGGAAAGIDYRLDPRFLVGLSAGYAAGNQWVDSFMGRGWTDTVSVIAYGSFTSAGYYADALAGYAYSGNQMQRQIQFPGLQRTANGSTGANQFLGQIETGYRIGLYAPAAASVTPFARLQGSTVTQNAFSEWGANSLSLNVAQQTTNSLRTVFGGDLAGAIGLGGDRTLALDLRLGWLHEYADTGRPITAAFAGAPSNAFTVYGATPLRDAAVIGFSAGTNIAEATQLYLRYDGEVSTGASNHTLNLGLRISW
jgi:autotransporter-associated beta strand protein/T5SS/PEP-CTERM-associated repeat protein